MFNIEDYFGSHSDMLNDDEDYYDASDLESAYDNGYADAFKWHDFSVEKPEKRGSYLVYNNNSFSVDVFLGNSWVGHEMKVDYWMELPGNP